MNGERAILVDYQPHDDVHARAVERLRDSVEALHIFHGYKRDAFLDVMRSLAEELGAYMSIVKEPGVYRIVFRPRAAFGEFFLERLLR